MILTDKIALITGGLLASAAAEWMDTTGTWRRGPSIEFKYNALLGSAGVAKTQFELIPSTTP